MSKIDLTKSFIKRQILLPIINRLSLRDSKLFQSIFNYFLASLPLSDEDKTRLREDFLYIIEDNQSPPVPIDKEQKKTTTIPTDSDPVSYPPVRLIAFYLPQFHAIPENNEWWGEGFTEWTNVKSATPQFPGHYHPVQPGELGHYNLDDIEIMERQAELAKLYGIEGFCFYFYWFAGKRLLEKPILQFLDKNDIEQPFCLCWANENWSRRWDGLDSEILIAQDHSPEDDLAFIEYIAKYINDPRYIRIDNKPLLLVYRPSLLPAPAETAKRWREWCRDNGIGDIFLAYTQSFETIDPKEYGFDAAIEFPPNNSAPPLITEKVPQLNDDFTGKIYDWSVFPQRSENYPPPQYPLFRGVCPAWDNTARRKTDGAIFLNNSPQEYQRWLSNAVYDTVQRFKKCDERFVFINAWNEWAEGAYLEPDERLGHAYLEATRKSLIDATRKIIGRRILLVSHDAHPHGAQYLTLNMAKMLHESLGFTVELVVLGEGPLIEEYQKYANVHEFAEIDPLGDEVSNLLSNLFKHGVKSAITNTTVSGLIVPTLKKCGFKVISLIHELPQLIKDYELQDNVNAIAQSADKVVFAAAPVLDGFTSFCQLDEEKIVIRPQGLYKKNKLQSLEEIAEAKITLRERFHLAKEAKIVLGVGFADYRKGIDIFVQSGIEILKKGYKVYFLWLGNFDILLEEEIKLIVKESGFGNFFFFPGLDYNTDIYYAGADIYALTSREDPFPSVVMEALDVFTPVVAFSNAGGSPELLAKGGGMLVDKMTSQSFAAKLTELLDNPELVLKLAKEGKNIIDEDFSFRHYLFDLLDVAGSGLHRISAVVPNYNYEQYIEERLQSIIRQSYPVYEIIVLDDASTDNSISVIKNTLKSHQIDHRIIINKKNSGSVFSQWKNGVAHTKGSHVWIAEADDSCSCDFLDEVVQGFDSAKVVLSYCESKQVDDKGKVMADNYLDYVSDIDPHHWQTSFINEGREEAANALCVKNTIPNVSGVVFEKKTLQSVLARHIDLIKTYRIAGDWLVYIQVLKHGKIAFSPTSLNFHRRHQESVTIASFNEQLISEIERMQTFIANEFDVPQDKHEIASQYIETLRKQFGLLPS